MYIQTMQLITTTELRTRSKELISALLAGESVELIHRSKIIGEVRPKKKEIKVFNANRIKKIVERMNFEPLSYSEIEKKYRKHIMDKYGKSISRHQ